MILGRSVAAVLIGVVVAWLDLNSMRSGSRWGRAALALGGAAVFLLFLTHKLAPGAAYPRLHGAHVLLGAVGFSYVALRWVDAARAIREGRQPPPGLVSTVNYLLPFHMLAAGPIQAYDDFVAQPAVPPAPGAPRDGAGGCRSDRRRAVQGEIRGSPTAIEPAPSRTSSRAPRGPYLLLEVQLNYLWLYLDFSAYSDIAVGVGRLMGVATPENFNRPYLARNVIDYWDRWHISLSQFIRRNLFIPIQLDLMRRDEGRHPLAAASVAFTIAFLLCGLWHSISWPWLAWGGFNAAGLIACNLYRQGLLKRLGRKGLNRYMADPRVRAAGVVATFEFVAVGLAIAMSPTRGSTYGGY